jgi:predicted Zn-dependent protease
MKTYTIGVMKAPVASTYVDFGAVVDAATQTVDHILTEQEAALEVSLFEFSEPEVKSSSGRYSALDFLQLGMVEKMERQFSFLLIITDVELIATNRTYTMALPSTITNIAVISIRRLTPIFWNQSTTQQRDIEITAARLAGLMLHTLGHLLDMKHHPNPDNIMHLFHEVDELEQMRLLTPEQVTRMQQNLPKESHDELGESGSWLFAIRQTLANSSAIVRTMIRANPFALALGLPTMLTAGFSFVVVLFFSAEIWDVASTVEVFELAIFSLAALAISTYVVSRGFQLPSAVLRNRKIAETMIVTVAAVIFSIFLTMVVMYTGFFILFYLGSVTFFPDQLMSTWPTVDPATRVMDHVKLSMFLGAMGILVGSLGARAENKSTIRRILFLNADV